MKFSEQFKEYRKNLENTGHGKNCPVQYTLRILQGKWNEKIIYELSKYESLRFGELKKIIPEITNTMLSSTLKDLEEQGLVKRAQFNEIPVRVEYSLTEKGQELHPIFEEMAKWGLKYIYED